MNDTITISKDFARDLLEELYELRGERDWWKDEPRCNYQRRHQGLCAVIEDLEKRLKED